MKLNIKETNQILEKDLTASEIDVINRITHTEFLKLTQTRKLEELGLAIGKGDMLIRGFGAYHMKESIDICRKAFKLIYDDKIYKKLSKKYPDRPSY